MVAYHQYGTKLKKEKISSDYFFLSIQILLLDNEHKIMFKNRLKTNGYSIVYNSTITISYS